VVTEPPSGRIQRVERDLKIRFSRWTVDSGAWTVWAKAAMVSAVGAEQHGCQQTEVGARSPTGECPGPDRCAPAPASGGDQRHRGPDLADEFGGHFDKAVVCSSV
jgi:hypothetical protein